MMNALKKTFCCLLSATVLTVSASTAFAKSADFTDVPEKGWYTEAVDYVSEAGLFSGKGNGKFDPDGVMNRAMMVQVLANATENYKKESFTVNYQWKEVCKKGRRGGKGIKNPLCLSL